MMAKAYAHPLPNSVLLPGLDGSNPLGFLAALGVLRTLSFRTDAVRMQWRPIGATWKPEVISSCLDIDEVVRCLTQTLGNVDVTPWELDKKLPFSGEKLRDAELNAIHTVSCRNRNNVDTLCSFGVESARDANGTFTDTSLRMVRAGDSVGNGLLAYSVRIQTDTTIDDLHAALVGPWKYEDEGCALRWDPAEHHGYATQWTNPSKEATVSVRGANRLALAAMPLLWTVPTASNVSTVGFGRLTAQQESLTWPLWTIPCQVSVICSMLTLDCLQVKQPDSGELHSRGVSAAYRCDRVMTSTYYRNFTPARRIA